MSFIIDAATGAYQDTIDRVRRAEDHGQFNPRPRLDEQQLREFQEEQRQGLTDEPFRQCLAYHKFRWFEVQELPMLEGGVYRREGEWRHLGLRLAFTPTDLASGFPLGPESLDRYVRDLLAERLAAKKRVPKSELRKHLNRR